MSATADRGARLALCAALAARDEERAEASMAALRAAGDPVAVEETLLQTYLFLGYPVTLNAIARWREVSGRPAPALATEDWELWSARGADVCRRVYGGQYEDLRENVRALHPDMERWMVTEGYGKVLGRPGLDLKERELCIVALLAVLDTPRQLYSHVRGARNVGASDAEIEDALAAADPFLDAHRRERAREVWARVRNRAAGAR
jgi:4-carboxymuconolactone decarboxylase